MDVLHDSNDKEQNDLTEIMYHWYVYEKDKATL
jgi:hypothetical protein